MFFQEIQHPSAARLTNVVVVLFLVGFREIGRIMAVQKNALFPVGRQVGFQPGSLLLFCGEARIDDLGVDDDEVAAVTVEGLILGAEVFVPERQVVLMDAGCRGPVVGFVADVVVARRQVERVFQFFDLLMKSRRRCSVQVGDGGHWVHQVADVDHEGQITTIQIADHVAHAPVGQAVDRKRGMAVVLALVHVRVGDHAETEQAPAERVGVQRFRGHGWLPV